MAELSKSFSKPSYLSNTPTIPDLYRYVVPKVAFKWEGLCILLELDQDGAKLATIRRDMFHLGAEMCLMQAFILWLRGGGKKPVSWHTVITCLQDMEFHAVVKDLQSILKPTASGELYTLNCYDTLSLTIINFLTHTDTLGLVEAPVPSGLSALLDTHPDSHTTPPAAARYQLKPAVESELRDYQWELALPGLSGQNYIICAPTGSGKTRVAGLIISEHLKKSGGQRKVLFMVNKVPLVRQQRQALEEMIEGVKMMEVAGETAPYKKAMLSASLQPNSEEEGKEQRFDLSNDIIVCTAGCLLNQLENKAVSLSAISLMVIDECHHTRKNSVYANIMDNYIRSKTSPSSSSSLLLPQVIGLTASPGAGDTARPTLMSVVDHMITLCAAMDATGGIHTVRRNIPELQQHQTSAEHNRAIVEGRKEDEPLITITVTIMTKLEELYKLKPPVDQKWSQKYSGWVIDKISNLQCQAGGGNRDKMSIFKTLKSLSALLLTYHNLTYEDAVAQLDQLHVPSGHSATHTEQHLSTMISQLKIKLESLARIDNPLLLRLEEILEQNFQQVPSSKGIVFVETKNEATSIHRWITLRPKLRNIRADVITGQTRDTGRRMTKAEQNASLEGFRRDSFNLVVSTSVLEEGLDVPACNLVIKYQKVTSEIAQLQSRGRARARHSQSFTIVNSESGKQFQEMLNDEKNILVEQALEMLPTGEYLCNGIHTQQAAILQQRMLKQLEAVERRHIYSPFEVSVCCSHCSAILCNGSDIHTIPTTSHYVVSNSEIFQRATVQPHDNPVSVPGGLSRIKKLFCAKCESQALGVIGKWWKNNKEYPVLTCRYLKFTVGEHVTTCKQWTKIPFQVSPLSSHTM